MNLRYLPDPGKPARALFFGHHLLFEGVAFLRGGAGSEDLGVVLDAQLGQVGPSSAVIVAGVLENPSGAYEVDGVRGAVGSPGHLFA